MKASRPLFSVCTAHSPSTGGNKTTDKLLTQFNHSQRQWWSQHIKCRCNTNLLKLNKSQQNVLKMLFPPVVTNPLEHCCLRGERGLAFPSEINLHTQEDKASLNAHTQTHRLKPRECSPLPRTLWWRSRASPPPRVYRWANEASLTGMTLLSASPWGCPSPWKLHRKENKNSIRGS